MEVKIKAILTLAVIVSGTSTAPEVKVGNPLFHAHPCNGSNEITASFEVTKNPEENNKYNVYINKKIDTDTEVYVTLNEEATLTLTDESYANVLKKGETFEIKFFKSSNGVSFRVNGFSYKVPYITSLFINNKEYCSQPFLGYLDQYVKKGEY